MFIDYIRRLDSMYIYICIVFIILLSYPHYMYMYVHLLSLGSRFTSIRLFSCLYNECLHVLIKPSPLDYLTSEYNLTFDL